MGRKKTDKLDQANNMALPLPTHTLEYRVSKIESELSKAIMRHSLSDVRTLTETRIAEIKADPHPMMLTELLNKAIQNKCSLEIVRCFLKAGANLKQADYHGEMRPLHYAVCGGFVGVVQCLVEGGADVNVSDSWGSTPLHYAARDGFMGGVLCLLEGGADIHKTDIEGQTPLQYAEKNGHTRLVECLLKAAKPGLAAPLLLSGGPQPPSLGSETVGSKRSRSPADDNLENNRRRPTSP